MVVRENTEGEYSGVGGRVHRGTPHEVAMQTTVVTRRGVERVMRYAFELARRRGRQRYVHCVTKSNALAHVMELWDEVFAQVAGEYPDVRTTRSHVDSSSMYLISRPAAFDVLVATNLMGDILSDEAAAVVREHRPGGERQPQPGAAGSRACSSRCTARPRTSPGRGSPTPWPRSWPAALLLDSLGEQEAARLVEGAVRAALARGRARTPDLGGTARTADVTAAVLEALG